MNQDRTEVLALESESKTHVNQSQLKSIVKRNSIKVIADLGRSGKVDITLVRTSGPRSDMDYFSGKALINIFLADEINTQGLEDIKCAVKK